MCACMGDACTAPAADRPSALRSLISAGADVNAQNLMGATALLALASNSPPPRDAFEVLLGAGADATLRGDLGDSPLTLVQQLASRPRHPPASHATHNPNSGPNCSPECTLPRRSHPAEAAPLLALLES